MNRCVETFSLLQRILARGRFENGIAHAFQIFSDHIAKRFRVFNEQDGFAAAEQGCIQCIWLGRLSGFVGTPEEYLENSALAWLAVDPNVSLALFDDAIDRG